MNIDNLKKQIKTALFVLQTKRYLQMIEKTGKTLAIHSKLLELNKDKDSYESYD